MDERDTIEKALDDFEQPTALGDYRAGDPPGMPAWCSLRAEGVYYLRNGREEDEGERFLCSPIRVLALARSREGESWGSLVSLADPDGREHQRIIPARLMVGDGRELLGILLDLGLLISSERGARSDVLRLLNEWRPSARIVSSPHPGWIDDSFDGFLYGEKRVIGASEAILDGDPCETLIREFAARGSLADWRQDVATLAVGNDLMIVAICQAMTGPFLEPLEAEGGGFHFRGRSSQGKSTLLRFACSVWGGPGLLQSWRTTDNALEGAAVACNSTLLALDELSEGDGAHAGKAAYMLANGRGKGRAKRSGGARPIARWRTAVLSSGEIGLAEKVEEAGGRSLAGQEVRILDIVSDDREHGAFDALHGSENGADFSRLVCERSARSFGTAGPALVEAFIADRHRFLGLLRRSMTEFHEAASARGLLRQPPGLADRATARMALVAAVGEFATDLGITGWTPGAARAAALGVLDGALEALVDRAAIGSRAAIERTRDFLAEHETRFERLDGAEPPPTCSQRAGWRDGETYYVDAAAWRSEVHRGADWRSAARHLADAGYLKREGGRLQAKSPRGVPGRTRTYAVLRSILDA